MAALGVRLGYVAGTAPRRLPFSDSVYYQLQATLLAQGRGFVDPFAFLRSGRSVPTAMHPPLYPLVLALGSRLGGGSVPAHQVLGCVVGTATVLVVGVLTGRLAGRRAGLWAALLAAVYPPMWVNDGGIDAEGLYALAVALVLLAAYRFLAGPSLLSSSALGAAVAVAALVRAEAVLLVVVLVVPLAWSVRRLGARRATALAGAAAGCCAVVLSPWAIRNLATFDRPVFLSTGSSVLAGANCDATYHGPLVGLWDFGCLGPHRPGADESVVAAADTGAGLAYARHHLGAVPRVAAVRLARMWQLYGPRQDAASSSEDGRPSWAEQAEVDGYYVLLPLSVVGAVRLRRRGVPLLPLAAQVVLVSAVAVASWGAIRFRVPADVALVVLGGVALGAGPAYGDCWRAKAAAPARNPATSWALPEAKSAKNAGT